MKTPPTLGRIALRRVAVARSTTARSNNIDIVDVNRSWSGQLWGEFLPERRGGGPLPIGMVDRRQG